MTDQKGGIAAIAAVPPFFLARILRATLGYMRLESPVRLAQDAPAAVVAVEIPRGIISRGTGIAAAAKMW